MAFGWRDVKLLFLQKRGQAPLNKKILQTKKYSKLKNLKSNPTCLNPSGRPARPTLPPSPQKPEEGCFWYQIWISISISKNNRGDLGHIVSSFDARHYINELKCLQSLSPVLFRHNHHRQPTPLCFVVSCKTFCFFLHFCLFKSFRVLLSPLCRTYYLDHSSEAAVSQEDVLNRLQISIFMMISSKWKSCCLPLSPDSHSEEWQVCWGPLCRLSLASGWRSSTERTLTFVHCSQRKRGMICTGSKKWESG